jgi:hypothetical protein
MRDIEKRKHIRKKPNKRTPQGHEKSMFKGRKRVYKQKISKVIFLPNYPSVCVQYVE